MKHQHLIVEPVHLPQGITDRLHIGMELGLEMGDLTGPGLEEFNPVVTGE
jgi:hypothetical protein